MKTTRLLALDLSIAATGVTTPDGISPDGRLNELQVSTIITKRKGDFRLSEIKARVRHLATNVGPVVDWVILEDLPPTRAFSTKGLGMVHGAVRCALIEEGIPYLEVTPSQLKKYATGKGTSPKPTLRMELYKRTGLDLSDDNQVDAAWLWLLGHDLAGDPVINMPQVNRSILDKLTMPEIRHRDESGLRHG